MGIPVYPSVLIVGGQGGRARRQGGKIVFYGAKIPM
jgi:hypothetical protein